MKASATAEGGERRDGPVRRGPGRAFALGLVLTFGFAAVEAIAGFLSGSLALVADAGHMLVDSSGLVLAFVATQIARRPPDLKRTFGYARAEVLVVPLQVALMLGLGAYIVYEAVGRIGGEAEIEGWPVLLIGVAGLLLNLAVFRLVQRHAADNLNARGVMLEVWFDALGSLGVIASAGVLILTGWTPVDVIVSLLIGALVLPRGLALLREVVAILLEGTPPGLDVAAIEEDARSVPGVSGVHDLHLWALAPSFVALSAHVEVSSLSTSAEPLAALARVLREKHEISHVTLQPETKELHAEMDCCLFPDAPADNPHEHAPAS
ncbi:MAG: cation diffusion facilitator family transporter [Dehalococcoidia bacterium]